MREYKEGKEDFYNKILSDKNNLEIIQYNTVPTFSIKQKYALKNLKIIMERIGVLKNIQVCIKDISL